MSLSIRLNEILDLIEPCSCLMDVGCDHGFVPIEAVRRGKAACAIAADARREPLLRARENIGRAGLEDRIEVLLSDGFRAAAMREPGDGMTAEPPEDVMASKHPGDTEEPEKEGRSLRTAAGEKRGCRMPDAAVIAGMGGGLMADILSGIRTLGNGPEIKSEREPEIKSEIKSEIEPEREPESKPESKPEREPEREPESKPEIKAEIEPESKPISEQEKNIQRRVGKLIGGMKQLILSPQSEPEKVRRLIIDGGLGEIVTERYVYEDGKYYCLMKVLPGRRVSPYREMYEYYFGSCIESESREVYRRYLEMLKSMYEEALEKAGQGGSEKAGQRKAELQERLIFAGQALKAVNGHGAKS